MYSAYNYNPLWQWFWKHGGEEPINPLGPVGQGLGPSPDPWVSGIRLGSSRVGPSPEPWREAVLQLMEAAQAKDLALRLEGHLKDQAVKSATAAIEVILDDWCGTPPRKWPWPWPGPPPWTWAIASELSLVANSLQPGSLKDGLQQLVGQVAQKAGGARV